MLSSPTVGSSPSTRRRRGGSSWPLALLLTGCAEDEKAAPDAPPTPIASLNTVAMQLPRIEFCELVPDSAVSDALGGKPDSDSSYGNGDEVELPGVGKDVVHEIGCSWTAEDGTTARAWVFARPVNAAVRPVGDRLGQADEGLPHGRRARRTASRPRPRCAARPTGSSASGTPACSGRPG